MPTFTWFRRNSGCVRGLEHLSQQGWGIAVVGFDIILDMSRLESLEMWKRYILKRLTFGLNVLVCR